MKTVAHFHGTDDHHGDSARIDWLAAQYDRHGQQVYSLALHITREQAEAEAVVVEAFLALHRSQLLGGTSVEAQLLCWTQDIAILRLTVRTD